MSKELTPLEALEALENIKCDILDDNFENKQVKVLLKELKIIEIALRRLKIIDCWKEDYSIESDEELLRFIHNGWYFEVKGEKELKALEIIREKRVDIDKLLYYLKTNACDDSVLSWYNEYSVEFDDERTLTQEEYDLLKEVLL